MPAAHRPVSRLPAPELRGTRQRKGFNLIEAAIVLGVVGLVIGGIWIAATEVKERNFLRAKVASMLVVNENIRNLFKGQDTTGNIPFTQNYNILTVLTKGAEGVMLLPSQKNSSFLTDSKGSSIYLQITNNTIQWDFGNSGVSGIPTDECIKLFAAITTFGGDTILNLQFNQGGTVGYTGPLIPTAGQCTQGTQNPLVRFKL